LTRVAAASDAQEPEVEGLLALMFADSSPAGPPARTARRRPVLLPTRPVACDGALIAEGQGEIVSPRVHGRNRPGPTRSRQPSTRTQRNARSAAKPGLAPGCPALRPAACPSCLTPLSSRSTGVAVAEATVPLRRWSLSTASTWAYHLFHAIRADRWPAPPPFPPRPRSTRRRPTRAIAASQFRERILP